MPIKIQEATREEYRKKYGELPVIYNYPKEDRKEVSSDGNFLTGLAKSGLSTFKGALQMGEKFGGEAIIKGVDKLTGKENISLPSEQEFLSDEKLKSRGASEKMGKFVGDVAQYAIPQSKLVKAPLAARALVSGAVGAAQTGSLTGGAIAGATEAAIPGVGAVFRRLFKGLGSGLSGGSSTQIEALLKNPKAAQQEVRQIKARGGASVLTKRAEAIVQGISKVKQDARKAFGKGLEALAKTDINPSTFRDTIGATLSKFGSAINKGRRVLQNVEFNDPKNIKKASELIDKLSRVELDGKSLRKLADDIASAAYRTATSDERLAFNAFVKDLSSGLKDAISKSTSKLDEINKAFSADIQLAEGMEKIFGKVKFKNLKEILGVSQELENLFNQNGLAPEIVDRFLTKIGINPSEFKAQEAARQMGELIPRANTIGISVFEAIRSFAASIVPPTAIRDIAIATGLTRDVVQELATKLSPAARGTLIRYLLGNQSEE